MWVVFPPLSVQLILSSWGVNFARWSWRPKRSARARDRTRPWVPKDEREPLRAKRSVENLCYCNASECSRIHLIILPISSESFTPREAHIGTARMIICSGNTCSTSKLVSFGSLACFASLRASFSTSRRSCGAPFPEASGRCPSGDSPRFNRRRPARRATCTSHIGPVALFCHQSGARQAVHPVRVRNAGSGCRMIASKMRILLPIFPVGQLRITSNGFQNLADAQYPRPPCYHSLRYSKLRNRSCNSSLRHLSTLSL